MQIKNTAQRCVFLLVLCFLCILPQKISAKEANFTKNSSVTISQAECYATSGSYTWIQYKASADGYLTVQASDLSSGTEPAKGYIALYNSTRTTLLSPKTIFYNTTYSKNPYWCKFQFGLLKGQTYYLRIKAENAVKLSCSFKKVSDKSGALQTNALTLKKDKKKTGLIPAGVSNADWYKLKLTKKQKIRLYYNAKTSGSFRISIYSEAKCVGTKTVYYTSGEKKLTLCQYQKSTDKTSGMEKGTYYVKIERADATSSGYYTIKWK